MQVFKCQRARAHVPARLRGRTCVYARAYACVCVRARACACVCVRVRACSCWLGVANRDDAADVDVLDVFTIDAAETRGRRRQVVRACAQDARTSTVA
eukprot:5172925-Pleurochrysis_carterae.AAC.2